MTFDGIIFDFNGVLLWDARFQVQAWQTVARDLRGQELSDDEIAMHVHGRPNSHILSYLSGRDVTGKNLLDLIEFKESMYRDLCLRNSDSFELSPGACSLLDSLAAAKIPRTIATASELLPPIVM